MTTSEMSCKELVELITEYLEGTISGAERARFEAHLAGCDGCTTYLRQMRKTIRWTGMLSEEQISDEVREKLLEAFRNWKK